VRRDRLLVVAAWSSLVATVLVLLIRSWSGGFYSPDSWMFWSLAKTFPAEIGAVSFRITFGHASSYQDNYQLGWPLLLWLFGSVTRLDWRSGLVLGVVLFLSGVFIMDRIGARWTGRSGWGALVGMLLLAWPPFTDDLLAARTAGLVFFLVAVIGWSLLPPGPLPWSRLAILGLALFWLVFARLDQVLFVLLTLLVLARTRVRERRQVLALVGAVLLALATWSAYSLARHHQPFASSNGPVVVSATNIHAASYVKHSRSVFQDPGSALKKYVTNSGRLLHSLYASFSSPFFLATLVLLTVVVRTASSGGGWPGGPGASLFVLLGCLAAASTAVQILLTGYADTRYWIPAAGMFSIAVIISLDRQLLEQARTKGLFLPLFAVMALSGVVESVPEPSLSTALGEAREAAACVGHRSGAILFASAVTGAAFSSQDSRSSVFLPQNWRDLSGPDRDGFLRDFDPKAFVLDPPAPSAGTSPGARERRNAAEGVLGGAIGDEVCPNVFTLQETSGR
jgi:hypothetical protein